MKITKYELIATVAIIVLLFFFIKININKNNKLSEINTLYKVAQDSMVTYRNTLGQQIAKVEPLIASNQKYFLQLKTNDAQIKELQDLVTKESKGRRDVESAMIVKNKTIYNLQDSIKNKIIGQTIEHRGDSTLIWPTYQRITVNKWINDTIQIGKKVFNHKLLVYNDYDIVVGNEPVSLFKKKSFATVQNLNPNCETTTLKVYQLKEEPRVFWPFIKGGVIGAGIMFLIKSL